MDNHLSLRYEVHIPTDLNYFTTTSHNLLMEIHQTKLKPANYTQHLYILITKLKAAAVNVRKWQKY